MRLLLDTHVLLWALTEPGRLSAAASSAVRSSRNQLYVSAVSALEITTKVRLGKLPTAVPLVTGYIAYLAQLRAEELAISTAHAILAGGLEVAHRDPFDRVLAAQAMLDGLILVTADAAFAGFSNLITLW